MVSRLVKKLGDYSITRDGQGHYSLLDPMAREVAAGPDLDAMEGAARLLGSILELRPGNTWPLGKLSTRGQDSVPGDPETWRPS